MRVLMLNSSGSAQAYTHNLCNALVRAGAEVDLFTSPFYEQMSRGWRDVRYVPRIVFYRWTQMASFRPGPLRPVWRGLRLAGHITMLTRLLPVVRRYDALHLHFPPVLPADARWLQVIRRQVAVVHTVHNLWPHRSQRGARDRQRLRRLYHACHHLIAHTEDTVRGLIEEFGVSSERISRIPHGNFRQLWDEEGTAAPVIATLPKHIPTILMFGELRHAKGADVLLRAAAILRARGMDFRVLLAGRPLVPVEPFRAQARELGIADRLIFDMRYLAEAEVASYFHAASVVVLPYRAIDQSGVAVAAATMGRAIVATRIAGLAELVEQGDCGLLVPVDDPESLAAALERILRDDRLRQRFETNGRQYAETSLAWKPIADQTINAYRNAGAPRRRVHRAAYGAAARVSSDGS